MGFHSKSFRFEGGGRQNEIGLKRTGKSCRLRWVNYLHPGLKRGKMTPHEERLVLELHSKWGNRWSRIARKLPGRTDNEIKNYWRTHMRKKAQEKKRASSPSSSLLSNSSSSMASTSSSSNSTKAPPVDERSFYDTGGLEMVAKIKSSTSVNKNNNTNNEEEGCYSMDEIWKDIDLLEDGMSIKPVYDPYSDLVSSPMWDYSPDSLWTATMDGVGEIGNSNMFFPAIAGLTG